MLNENKVKVFDLNLFTVDMRNTNKFKFKTDANVNFVKFIINSFISIITNIICSTL